MIIGIDPGMKGALAALEDSGDTPDILQMPMLDKIVDIRAIVAWLKDENPTLVVVEHTHGFGAGNAHRHCQQGIYYGQLLGWLQTAQIPYMTVTALKWRNAIVGAKKGKEASVTFIKNFYPVLELSGDKSKRSGQADAICIALYGRRFLND